MKRNCISTFTKFNHHNTFVLIKFIILSLVFTNYCAAQSWQSIPLAPGLNQMSAYQCVGGGNYLYAQDQPGDNFYRYDGSSWQSIPLAPGLNQMIADQCVGGGNYLYAGGQFGDNFYRYDGSSWQSIPLAPGLNQMSADQCVASGNYLYAGSQFGDNFYRYDGSSWQSIPLAPGLNQMRAYQCVGGGNYLYAQDQFGDNFYRYDGSSWQSIPLAPGFNQMSADQCVASGNYLYAGSQFGDNFYRYDGSSWQSIPLAPGLNQMSAGQCVASGNYLYAGSQFGDNFYSYSQSTVSPPTASAQTFCWSKTIADLVATGTDLQWYDVETGGTALASTTVLATGTYYVSQTVSGNESTRTSVAVTITPSTTNTTSATACTSYTWANNSQTYTASGTYTGTTTNCVTEQLVLTIIAQLQWYLDADSDGYYTGSAVSSCTSPGAGYTTSGLLGGGDCDDTITAINPGAAEICYDGIDNDCDGTIDNGCVPLVSVVQTAQCGQTLASIDSYVYANLVAGVQGYRFKVTNMVTNEVQTIDRFLRVFRITQLPNYAFNTEYQVEVAVRKFNIWQPTYGAPCTVKTPATTTQLINCGASLTAMTDIIYANLVPFATGYQFKVTNVSNPSDTQTINRNLREFRMSLLSGIQYNTTYTVEVAVRNTDGVTYLPYGPVCEVTTPIFPASYLQESQCADYLVPSNSTILYAQSFTGAEGYRFRLQNAGLSYSQAVDRNLRTVRLSDFTGLTPGTTYAVKVALKINGVWGSFTGKGCSIITPGGAPARIDEETVVVKGNFAAVAYPNPFASVFAIRVQTSSQEVVQLKVYDMLGRLVEQRETTANDKEITAFGERYPSGVYSVVVTQGGITETLRVIKR